MKKETKIQRLLRWLSDIKIHITTGKSNKQREKEMLEGWLI